VASTGEIPSTKKIIFLTFPTLNTNYKFMYLMKSNPHFFKNYVHIFFVHNSFIYIIFSWMAYPSNTIYNILIIKIFSMFLFLNF